MKRSFTNWLSILALVPLATSCLGSGNSVNVYGGARALDTSDYGSLDDQVVYGADVVMDVDLPFLGVEGGWLHAEQDDSSTAGLVDPELSSDEYFVGVRVTPWEFLVEPYASIGVTYVDASLDTSSSSDDDNVLAYYLRIGAAFTVGIVRLGLDGRALLGSNVDLQNIDSDLDNLQLTGFVGISW